MAINYDEIVKKKQLEADDLLTKRKEDILGQAPIVNTSVLNNLANVPGLDVGALAAARAQQAPEFIRKASERTDRQRLNQSNVLQEMIYQNAIEKAKQAGLNLRDSQEFARRVLEQRQEQQFQAEESQKDRNLQLRKEKLSDIYADKGVALQNQYAFTSDPQAALMRALLGTGASIATYKYLQNKQNKTIQPTVRTAGVNDFYGGA